MDWMRLIEIVVGFIAGGGVVKLVTLKSSRKKGNAEADGAVVNVLNEVINTLHTVDDNKDKEIADLKKECREKSEMIISLQQQLADKRCENTTKGYYMCVHQGCVLRRPTMGRGKEYYDAHSKEVDFGADFESVEQLLKAYKLEKKEEQANGNNQ